MKETVYDGSVTDSPLLSADEPEELRRLSDLIQADGLRYERVLKAEEEVHEL